jgi:hypothetical protein
MSQGYFQDCALEGAAPKCALYYLSAAHFDDADFPEAFAGVEQAAFVHVAFRVFVFRNVHQVSAHGMVFHREAYR